MDIAYFGLTEGQSYIYVRKISLVLFLHEVGKPQESHASNFVKFPSQLPSSLDAVLVILWRTFCHLNKEYLKKNALLSKMSLVYGPITYFAKDWKVTASPRKSPCIQWGSSFARMVFDWLSFLAYLSHNSQIIHAYTLNLTLSKSGEPRSCQEEWLRHGDSQVPMKVSLQALWVQLAPETWP